jgi:hypothetical protein
MLWILSQSDGTASLLDVAERSGIGLAALRGAAEDLAAAGLLRDADEQPGTAPKKPSTRKKPSKRKKSRKGDST